MKTLTFKHPGNAKMRMKKLHCTSKVAGIRKSKLINHKAVPQWKPVSGLEDYYKPVVSIELRIDRFAEFARNKGEEDMRTSALTSIRGVPWLIYAYLKEIDEKDNQKRQPPSYGLTCFLECVNETTDTAWNCQLKWIYRIVSQKEGVDDSVQSDPEPLTYSVENPAWGHDSLITIDKLLDTEEGLIKDDTVILQVDVTSIILFGQDDEDRNKAFDDVFGSIDKCQLFSSSTEYPWDFVLHVQGKRVHVQKSMLSSHSEYFKEQFAKYKSIKRAVLQNIDYNEFIELLSVISPTSYPITVENVETIAKLAYVFKVRGVARQCEAVLMINSSRFGVLRAFLMSHWYGMEHLQAKCVDELKAIDGLKKLKDEPEFTALDCRTKAILLDKIVESNPVVHSATKYVKPSRTVSKARVSEILDKLASSAVVESDAVLIVEGNKIPVHKSYLAMYSRYFKAMFHGEFKEKNQGEIALEEVAHTDILELLAVIYPCVYPVTEKNLEAVLKLADRFIMPAILERCNNLLKSSRKIKRALKLWLSQRYNFPDLLTKYANEYKSVEDVSKLKAEPEYESLNDETRSLIFDSIIS